MTGAAVLQRGAANRRARPRTATLQDPHPLYPVLCDTQYQGRKSARSLFFLVIDCQYRIADGSKEKTNSGQGSTHGRRGCMAGAVLGAETARLNADHCPLDGDGRANKIGEKEGV